MRVRVEGLRNRVRKDECSSIRLVYRKKMAEGRVSTISQAGGDDF